MRMVTWKAVAVGLLLCCTCVGCGGNRNVKTATITARAPNTIRHGVPAPQSRKTAPNTKLVRVLGIRKFPYPFQAMLAISSDADHQTLRKFNLIHRFINTTEPTPMGRGLGLDISDSFFMYNGSDFITEVDYKGTPISGELTYFRGLTQQRYAGDIIDGYIHAGWIDTIHTYGDFNMRDQSRTRFTRALARNGIGALRAHGDAITVWVDHGNRSNVDNFGSYGKTLFFNYQQGANPKSPYYHTGMLIPYGVRFVWAGESSDTFGYDNIVYPIQLPDGRKVWGFNRYTSLGYSRRFGTEWLWTVDLLAQELTLSNLVSIERNHRFAIVGQHLAADNEVAPLPQNGITALRRLSTEYHRGRILVARTSRLLQYNVSERYLRYYVTQEQGKAVIHLTSVQDPVFGSHAVSLADIRGITFYTTDAQRTEIRIWNVPLNASLIQRNPTDGVAPSVSVKWYPPDTRDHSIAPSPTHYVI